MAVLTYRALTAGGRAEHGRGRRGDVAAPRGRRCARAGSIPTELGRGRRARGDGRGASGRRSSRRRRASSRRSSRPACRSRTRSTGVGASTSTTRPLGARAHARACAAPRGRVARRRARREPGACSRRSIRELVRAGRGERRARRRARPPARDDTEAERGDARPAPCRARLPRGDDARDDVAVLGFLLVWVVPQMTSALRGRPGSRSRSRRARSCSAPAALIARRWWLRARRGRARRARGRGGGRDAGGPRAARRGSLLRVPGVRRGSSPRRPGRLARTLATLLGGGVPLEAALGLAGPHHRQRLLADAVAAAREARAQGGALAPALARDGAFAPRPRAASSATASAGACSPTRSRTPPTRRRREVERAVAAATALVEPVLVLLMGGVVLVLVHRGPAADLELGPLAG